MAPLTLNALDVERVHMVVSNGRDFPSALSAETDGSLWVRHGTKIIAYDWVLRKQTTTLTELYNIDCLCRIFESRAAVGSTNGVNFVSNNYLDGVLKECFLDLGLFPRDRKVCADALLDICVYVRNLQRYDAFAISSELESRDLLNLTSTSRGSTTISYGNGIASELYFSQPDGMPDLVLHLGHHGNIQHCKRLVIELKNFRSSQQWELFRYGALDT